MRKIMDLFEYALKHDEEINIVNRNGRIYGSEFMENTINNLWKIKLGTFGHNS